MTSRSLEADVVRTSECAFGASKRPPSRSLLDTGDVLDPGIALDGLADDAPWLAAYEAFRVRAPRRHDRLAAYESLLAEGAHRSAGAAVLAGAYRPSPPVERWVNKADGRKKRVFQYPPLDELLLRAVHGLIQPAALSVASPWCRSFLPGGGPRAALRGLLATPDRDAQGSLRLDVRDYFNSIDVDDLLRRLRDSFTTGALGALLDATLLDPRVVRGEAIVDDPRKGIMAGTPLAPLLAALYLGDLDAEIAAGAAGYARYSDDLLVLAEPARLVDVERLIRARLAERGLVVNEDKSCRAAPGEPWTFVGFRYQRGAIGLSEHTIHKFRTKTTRLARRLHRWRERDAVEANRVLRAFIRRTNRRLYGGRLERAEFSWATWFLPMLDGTEQLGALDQLVQREARYTVTGRRTERTRAAVPYSRLVDTGYLPLVSAHWAMRQRRSAYDELVTRRTGLGRSVSSGTTPGASAQTGYAAADVRPER